MKKQSRKTENIVQYTPEQLRQLKSQTDYQRLDNMKDSDIDYNDVPATDERFWTNATIKDPGAKQAISLRVDKEIIDWFKHQNGRYQVLINQVLRKYVNAHR